MKITVGGREFEVALGNDRITVDGKEHAVSIKWDDGVPIVSVDGLPFRVELPEDRMGEMTVVVDHRPVRVHASGTPHRRVVPKATTPSRRAPVAAAGAGVVTATMTGEIVEVHVTPGDRVEAGAVLAILEAMKMRNEVLAPVAGTVERVEVQPGKRVNLGDVLIVLQEAGG